MVKILDTISESLRYNSIYFFLYHKNFIKFEPKEYVIYIKRETNICATFSPKTCKLKLLVMGMKKVNAEYF